MNMILVTQVEAEARMLFANHIEIYIERTRETTFQIELQSTHSHELALYQGTCSRSKQ